MNLIGNVAKRALATRWIRTLSPVCCKYSKNAMDECYNPIQDKSVLITGGARGIGLECAKALLKEGCRGVTIADIDSVAGECALKEICQEFGNNKAIFVKCDVMKSELIDWAFKNAIRAFDQLDIVINNAGVLNDKRWETEVATNLGGYLVGNLLALQYMSCSCNGNGGVVVNICSTMGITPYCGCPIYSMTQAGIIGLTRALGEGIQIERTAVRIMALCAGLTDTDMLIEASANTLNDKFAKEFKDELRGEMIQDADIVACGVIDIIKKGCAGNVYVVDKGTVPYKIKYPCMEDMIDCEEDKDDCTKEEIVCCDEEEAKKN